MPGPQNNIKPKIEPGITIKQEPLASTSQNYKDLKGSLESLRIGSSRLPSFRGPRDLTLSASASLQTQTPRPKKTFLPNIPVRREKAERVVESRSEKCNKRNPSKFKHERGRGRGRGRGREKEFIQTKGSLFGDGIAASTFVKRSNFDYGGQSGGRSSKIGEMQKPVLNPDAAYNIDQDLEEQKLKEILRDDFLEDPDDDELDYLPVQLPLVVHEAKTPKTETKDLKEKKEDSSLDSFDAAHVRTRVKQEPGLEEEQATGASEELAQPETAIINKCNYKENSAYYNLYSSATDSLSSSRESELFLFQFPTTLPGLPPEVRPEDRPSTSSGVQAQPNSGQPQPQRSQNITSTLGGLLAYPKCTLDSLPEGYIGDINIYESGKVEYRLGEQSFIIEKGLDVGFQQDVVKIETDSEKKTGNMTVLGHIKDRFVISPNFESMIKNMKKS